MAKTGVRSGLQCSRRGATDAMQCLRRPLAVHASAVVGTGDSTAAAPHTHGIDLARYRKQTLFTEIGETGQQRLLASRVLVVGCGRWVGDCRHARSCGGGVAADRRSGFRRSLELAAAGVVDEQDVAGQLPKAVVAAGKLAQINCGVAIDPHVADINGGTC